MRHLCVQMRKGTVYLMMRVEQQQNPILEMLQQAGVQEKDAVAGFGQEIVAKRSSATGNQTVNMKDATYLKPGKEGKDTVADEIEQNGTLDATDRKNQMVVLAGTTSEEDYRKMQEDGFSLDSTTGNTIVTVTDKIKAQLAKAGVDISCFGDDLSMEQLQAITGNIGLAMQLAESMQKADLPVNEDSVSNAVDAFEQAQGIRKLDDGAIKYLLDNELEPTIDNLYMAEFAGGYQAPETLDVSSFEDQIKKVISGAGLEVNDTTMADSKWLLENEIPLTAENLQYMEALKNLQFPLDEGTVIDGITEAVAEGKSARDALLIPEFRLMEQAKQAADVVNNATEEDVDYLVDNNMEVTVANLAKAAGQTEETQTDDAPAASKEEQTGTAAGAAASEGEQTGATASDEVQDADMVYDRSSLDKLTARRQLEEIRLAMTVEANYTLLKKGISIDTEPISELIDQLKSMEQDYYVNLLKAQGADNAEEKASLLLETTEKIAGIKTVPAYVLGYRQADVSTIEGIHREGTALKDTFERANRSYETMMTMPNEELGDSIQKAFGNVDEILKDANLELTDANRRAVRILGYNQTAITQENVAQVKAADEEVQRAFKNLTPAVVTRMIKDGINPLEMDISEVNETAEQIASDIGDQDKNRFSEYLWKLEQNHQISEEERSAYIGIYRLIRQVDNTDGAAVGALLQQGAPVTMKNLLTAVRSEHRSGKMDVTVDDSYGGLESLKTSGVSITEQIEAGYQFNCLKDVLGEMTPGMIGAVMEQNPNWQDMTPEQLKEAMTEFQGTEAGEALAKEEQKLSNAYAKEQLAQFKESAEVSEDVYTILEKYDVPNTSLNLLAMDAMLSNRNQVFAQLFGGKNSAGSKFTADNNKTTNKKEREDAVLEAFAEALSDPEGLLNAQQQLTELAADKMENAMNQDAVTSLDIRDMKLLSAQIELNTSFMKEEQYSIPVRVDDDVVNISLKIVRGAGTKGIVDVTMEQEDTGKIAATFQAKEEGISGLITSDRKETKERLEGMAERLNEQLFGADEKTADIHYAQISDLDLNHFSMGAYGADADTTETADAAGESYQVQTARLYRIAENFIQLVQQTL